MELCCECIGEECSLNNFYFNSYSIINAVFGLISYYVFSMCLRVLLIVSVFFSCFCASRLLFQHVDNNELNLIMQGL